MSAGELTVAGLERWVDFGATWHTIELSVDHVVVELCQCTGELVERRESRAAEVIAYVTENQRLSGRDQRRREQERE